jgi:hypothetical protein
MLRGSCHCGAVRIEIPRRPNYRGVNARNFEPADIGAVRVRLLDGAKSWKYLD